MSIPSQPVQAIIFDFGGVLIDWHPHYLYLKHFNGDSAAVDAFLEEVGFAQWNAQQDAGRPFAEAVEELAARYPQYDGLIRAYDENWAESIGGPIQGTVQILRELKATGLALHALSNWSAEKFELVRPRLDFLDCFDSILLSGQVRLAKPDPRIYQVLLERIKTPAPDCLFIDDSAQNIATAGSLGFRWIHFSSPEGLRRDLVNLGLLNGKG